MYWVHFVIPAGAFNTDCYRSIARMHYYCSLFRHTCLVKTKTEPLVDEIASISRPYRTQCGHPRVSLRTTLQSPSFSNLQPSRSNCAYLSHFRGFSIPRLSITPTSIHIESPKDAYIPLINQLVLLFISMPNENGACKQNHIPRVACSSAAGIPVRACVDYRRLPLGNHEVNFLLLHLSSSLSI